MSDDRLPPGGVRITPEQAKELRERAKARLRGKRFADWYVGQALYEVRHSYVQTEQGEILPVYETWGYETWCDYSDNELGMERRNSERHYRVYLVFGVELRDYFDPERDLLNHSKMRLLCRVVNHTNLSEWLARARRLNVRELERACAAAARGETPSELFHYGLEVTAEEAAIIDRALLETRRRWGRRRKGASLTEALREWLKSTERLQPRT